MADWAGIAAPAEPLTIEIRGGRTAWDEISEREQDVMERSWQSQDKILGQIQTAQDWNREDAQSALEAEDQARRASMESELQGLSAGRQEAVWREMLAAQEEERSARGAMLEKQLMSKSRQRDDALWARVLAAREKQRTVVRRTRAEREVYDLERELQSLQSLLSVAERAGRPAPEVRADISRVMQKLKKLRRE